VRLIADKGDDEKKLARDRLHEIVHSGKYDVYFKDECHFILTLTLTRACFLKGIVPEIKSPIGRYKINIYGAMGYNGQLIIQEVEKINADIFKQYLETILDKAKSENKILLVLDNARYHHAKKKLKDYIESIKDRLGLFFLPPYSPEINPIKMLWKRTRRAVTHNRYFFFGKFCLPNDELYRLSAFI